MEDPAATQAMVPAVDLERPGFATKREMVEYLHPRLSQLPERGMLRNAGLWTWLGLYYFHDLCPVDAKGKRRVLNAYHYIHFANDGLWHYRHLIGSSYQIYDQANGYDELFLNGPPSSLGKITEDVMRRLYLTRIGAIWEVMERLYYDPVRGRPKIGLTNTANPRAGDLLNRLPRRIRQLERTYDLQSLNADQLLDLLGDEFRPWLEGTLTRT